MDILKDYFHGAAYYPESYGTENLLNDIIKMKNLGLNFVRMGEFAWSTLEPSEGNFDFTLFDLVIDTLLENNIYTVFCTPTATPPRWFTYVHPESLYVDSELHQATHGDREHVCLNNNDYINLCKRSVTKIAEHFAAKKSVIGWQIHNEINWPARECFCESCKIKWQAYLKEKFETVENLNKCWGTAVWSNTYFSFEQVIQPKKTYLYLHSPSITTEYARFNQKAVSNFVNMQINILKEITDKPVTTNVNRLFYIQHESITKNLDFISFDDYVSKKNYESFLLNCDFYSCMGKPSFVMETASSYSGCITGLGEYHKRGYVKAEAAAALLSGSHGFAYWLFKQHCSGAEIPHGHLVTAFNSLSSSTVNAIDVSQLIKEFEPFLRGSKRIKNKAAIIYSSDAKIYYDSEPQETKGYYNLFEEQYARLRRAGILTDAVLSSGDFDGYSLIYVPNIPYISDELWRKLNKAASDGAAVLMGAHSGTRTQYHTIESSGLLGKIERYTNITVKDYLKIDGIKHSLTFKFDTDINCNSEIETQLTEIKEDFQLKGSVALISGGSSLISVESEYFKADVVAQVRVGTGSITVACCDLGENTKKLLTLLAHQSGADIFYNPNIYVVKRSFQNKTIYACVNFSDLPQLISHDKIGTDILSGKPIKSLPPMGYALLDFGD